MADAEYFATLQPKELVSKLMGKFDEYRDFLVSSGRFDLMKRSHNAYYRSRKHGGNISSGGKQGEYRILYVNHYRNILKHILNMTTKQAPAFDPRATNTDHKSQAQCKVASNVLDYYTREKMMGKVSTGAMEKVLVYSEAYVGEEWDTDIGRDFARTGTGQVVKEGDVSFSTFSPLDCAFDFTRPTSSGHDWRIVRFWKNKFDLAVKYPELAEQIKAVSVDTKAERNRVFNESETPFDKSDLIPVYRFYHAKTPTLPQGRVFDFITDGIWLMDSPLNYQEIPVYRVAADDEDGTPFGYSIAFDILPIQEAIDALASIILTNQNTFGVQNVWLPAGTTISVEQIIDGLNLMQSDGKFGKPEALNLLNTPKEIFDFLQGLVNSMETIAGVNSVVRGNPEASLKSGSALALVQSNAIEFNSGIQKAYVWLLETLGTGLVRILKVYAKTPRLIAISGKSKKSYIEEFTGSDISDIDRVTVDLGNPVAHTTAGKINMADNLLNAKMIENPQQYLQVISTGQIEPLTEGRESELMLIRGENEALSEGKGVVATAIDDHPTHIMEHKSVMASPEARENPGIVTATLDHIQEHLNLWKTADPALLMVMGQKLPPPPPMPIAPPPTDPSKGPAPVPYDSIQSKAATVRPPLMPKNPMTGERVPVPASA